MHHSALLALVSLACAARGTEHLAPDKLDALEERAEYARLDKPAVEDLARAAAQRWPRELSGFTLERVDDFAAGGASHWMSIWIHGETGLEFVLLPGGTFPMGSPPDETDRHGDEARHELTLDPFLVARTECTRGAWARVMGESAVEPARLPKSGVSPADCESWCRRAGLMLPTEAQWEYLCRAGTTTAWTMGDEREELSRYANLGSAECPQSWIDMTGITEPWLDGYGDEPAEVGSFEPNAFGLFDVHGNLNEWCRDPYLDYEAEVDRGSGARSGDSTERVARGGNFGGDASAARSARRLRAGAGESAGNGGFGFRPSLDLPLRDEPEQLAQYPGAPFEDRSGNLWFSTVGEGLLRYNGSVFTDFTTRDGLAGDIVRDIIEDDEGMLWIGTDGGVSTFDGQAFTTLTDYGDIPVTRTFTEKGDHRDVWDLFRDRSGQVWIATLDGVFRFDGTTFAPFPLPALATEGRYEFTPGMVYCIYEDRGGDLWFGTDGAGAVRYDGETTTVYTVKEHGLASDRICAILEDSRGDFWFGTSGGGVSRYDGDTFTTHLRASTFSKHSGWGRFFAIHEDREGRVWFGVASDGGGVHRFDGESFRHFSTEDGLGTGGVPGIREDRRGNLWFGTTAGVFRFDGERFVSFTRDG